MNSEKLFLFPTLVKKYYNFLTSDECESISNFCKKNLLGDSHSLIYGKGTSSYDSKITTSYNSKISLINYLEESIPILGLENRIKKSINEYCNDFGVDTRRTIITNSWYNIQNENSVLFNHNHEYSFLVGVIFINVDNFSSPLFLENPNPYIKFKNFLFLNDNEMFNQYNQFFSITPEKAMLVIFPGWIQHGQRSEVNKTENRISISFNIEFNLREAPVIDNMFDYS